MQDPREKIRQFVWTNHIEGKLPIQLKDNTRLRTSGLLDSLATVGLISYIEKEFDVEFSAIELTVDNFDSINHIASLLSKKMK